MGKSVVAGGLESLSESLQKIKALLAWAELKRSETRHDPPPSFRLDDHLSTELRNEYGFFIKTAMDIHEFLNSKSMRHVSKGKRQLWRRELMQLETELRQLDLPVAL